MGLSPITSRGGGGVITTRYRNKPAGNITRASSTLGAMSTAWQITNVSVGANQNVLLMAQFGAKSTGSSDGLFAFLRGSTQLTAINVAVTNEADIAMMWVDENPGAGSYTYEIQAAVFVGTLTIYQTVITTDVVGGTSVFVADVYTP